MSRMMAELTMEAITATLKPKVSWGTTAAGETGAALGGAAGPSPPAPEALAAREKVCAHYCSREAIREGVLA